MANASQHLQVLRQARLVETEKHGLYVTYRLADTSVCEFFFAMHGLAERRLAEMEQITQAFLTARGELEPVDRENLLERVRRGEVVVLDVRPPEEFQAGHIPGAISMPLGTLKERLRELPADQEVVAYCRGPYCVMSIDAVELLRAHGLRACRLEDGVMEWRSRHWPVDEASA